MLGTCPRIPESDCTSSVCSNNSELSTTIFSLVSLLHPDSTVHNSFMISYIVHSSFSIIFPLHLLYFVVATKDTASSLLKGRALAISIHLAPGQKYAAFRVPVAKFLPLALLLTVGITVPSLLWFAAVSLTSYVFLYNDVPNPSNYPGNQNDRCNW